MLEGVEVEGRPEPVVQDRQRVLVELGRHPGRVVVGGLEGVAVLHQVRAKEEVVLGPEQIRHARQEARPRLGLEVSDRAAEQRDDPGAGERHALEVAVEIADEPMHLDPVLRGNRLGGRARDLLGDVHGGVGTEATGLGHRVEQDARLCRRARPQLDQGRRTARRRADVGGVVLQDRPLATGRVVLGQRRDLLEELRSPLVVEVARRELLEGLREARAHVGGHAGERPPGWQADVDRDVWGGGALHGLSYSTRLWLVRFTRRPSRSGRRRRSGGARAGPSCGSSCE